MNEILFLITALLLLSMITGLRMLIQIWGKRYRYKSAWELLHYEDGRIIEQRHRGKRYGR